jgi:hypothetical protein
VRVERGADSDERLMACRNPELAKLSAPKRESSIAATSGELEKMRDIVDVQGSAGQRRSACGSAEC